MKRVVKAALASAWTISLALAAADYAWWRGFNDGADTSMCAMSIIIDGNAPAMKRSFCQHIQNRKPPPNLFGMKRP